MTSAQQPAKENVTLSGVSETALLTLNSRATEARRPDAVLDDPMAITLLDSIDFDFAKFGGSGSQGGSGGGGAGGAGGRMSTGRGEGKGTCGMGRVPAAGVGSGAAGRRAGGGADGSGLA